MIVSTHTISNNEKDNLIEVLRNGIRPDGRSLNQTRDIIIKPISQLGVCEVQIGGTSIVASTSAVLSTPSSRKPESGSHQIFVSSALDIFKRNTSQIQTYIRWIWMKVLALEERALCVKQGDKAWCLKTALVIHSDDGAIIDASFAAIIGSLASLRFPSFDVNSGMLFPSSQHRSHPIALSCRPSIATIALINGRLFCDPSQSELLMSDGYSIIGFNEYKDMIFMDSSMVPYSSDLIKLSLEQSTKWYSSLKSVVDSFDPQLLCVGKESDYFGFEPKPFVFPHNSKLPKCTKIDMWKSDGKETFQFHIPIIREEVIEDSPSIDNKEGWLFSSI